MKRQRIRDAGWLHRWFFYRYETGEFSFVLEGDPREHEGYGGLERKYDQDGAVVEEYPVILTGSARYFGKFGRLTQNDQVVCTFACQHATEPDCVCACGGKNHGVSHAPTDVEDADSDPSPRQGLEIGT